jgi:hypothetical protein
MSPLGYRVRLRNFPSVGNRPIFPQEIRDRATEQEKVFRFSGFLEKIFESEEFIFFAFIEGAPNWWIARRCATEER